MPPLHVCLLFIMQFCSCTSPHSHLLTQIESQLAQTTEQLHEMETKEKEASDASKLASLCETALRVQQQQQPPPPQGHHSQQQQQRGGSSSNAAWPEHPGPRKSDAPAHHADADDPMRASQHIGDEDDHARDALSAPPGRSAQSGMGRANLDTGQSSEDLANMGKYLHSSCTSPHSSLEQAPVTTPDRGQVSTAVHALPRIFSAIPPPPYNTTLWCACLLRLTAAPQRGDAAARWCARARPRPRWLHV
jgi:hypothetical protein